MIWLLVASLLAAATVWFLQNFERVDYRYRVGMSGQARENPFLAAERTLRKLGLNASKSGMPRDGNELSQHGVVILSDARDALTPAAQAALLQWVAAGGHLITEDRAIERGDALLDALGVSATKGTGGARRTVQVEWGDTTYKLVMHAEQSLQTEQPLLAEAREGKVMHLLHFRHGDGYVTVLNDLYFMTNEGLDEADHADFLWALVQSGNGAESVLIAHERGGLSLMRWLSEHAVVVLASGALLILLWLWRVVPRFGRLIDETGETRRSLLEHLNASGRFLWNNGGRAQLAESARAVLMQRLLRHNPALRGLQGRSLIAALQKRYALSEEQAQLIARGGKVAGVAQFIGALQLYQRLHARLARSRIGEQQ